MSGSDPPGSRRNEPTWYDLIDPATDRVVGQVTRDGRVRSSDPGIVHRVSRAFDRQLLVRDGKLLEELGICFADIEPVGPADTSHHDLVFHNLGVLTGLIPAESEERGTTR